MCKTGRGATAPGLYSPKCGNRDSPKYACRFVNIVWLRTQLRAESVLSLGASAPPIVGVDRYALSCKLDMCLGRAEASRPMLRSSAVYKRRCS
jgi:hypothetical protein